MAIKKKAAKPAKKAVRHAAGAASKKSGVKKAAPKKSAKPAVKKNARPVSRDTKGSSKKPQPKGSVKAEKSNLPVAKATVHGKGLGAPKPIAKPLSKDQVPAKPAQPTLKPVPSGFKPSATPPPKTPVKKEPSKPVKVVIPELKTKSAVKYQPDFTKSVLDTPQSQIQTGPTMRYSDVELAEFKEIILKKLDAAKKELAYLQGLITRKDEMGGDESENRYMTMEDGSVSMEREQLAQMASRQITFIDHLEKALVRIENKTYGICRVTGKLIDKARLRAVPHATLSIEAKQMQHK